VSPRSRVLLSLLLAFMAGLGWLIFHNIDDLERRYRESAEETLIDTAQLMAALVATDIRDGAVATDRLRLAIPLLHRQRFQARIYQAIKREVNLRVYLTDRNGIVVYDSEGRAEGSDFSQWRDVRLTLQGRYGARTTRDVPGESRSSVMYVAAPVLWNGEIVGVATVGKPTVSYRHFIDTATQSLIAGGISAGLAVILAGLGVAIWIVRPFGLVTEYLRLFRKRGREGLPRLGRSALGMLGAAYDEMRDALAGRNYVEEYVQSLAHEIKSPLSAIRGAAELLAEDPPEQHRRQFAENIREQSERVRDVIDRLLELADLEKRRRLQELSRLDLAGLIRDTAETLDLAAVSRNVSFHLDLKEPAWVSADRFLLQRALTNLMQNALEFSSVGDVVEVTLETAKRHHTVRIRDHGPGIPNYAERRIFERFYSLPRPGTGKKSTGLGLSFVREIADLHHGSVELKNHPCGGALATLRLPRRR
jgi:two-component system sensor histidine kinase CreC